MSGRDLRAMPLRQVWQAGGGPVTTRHGGANTKVYVDTAKHSENIASKAKQDAMKREETRLEADVDVGPVDGGRPPQREAAVGDLVETRPLRVGELLVLHRLLEPACLGWVGQSKAKQHQTRALTQRHQRHKQTCAGVTGHTWRARPSLQVRPMPPTNDLFPLQHRFQLLPLGSTGQRKTRPVPPFLSQVKSKKVNSASYYRRV